MSRTTVTSRAHEFVTVPSQARSVTLKQRDDACADHATARRTTSQGERGQGDRSPCGASPGRRGGL